MRDGGWRRGRGGRGKYVGGGGECAGTGCVWEEGGMRGRGTAGGAGEILSGM